MNEALPADLFDGRSAVRQHVQVHWDAAALALVDEGGAAEHVPWAQVRLIDALPEAFLLGRADRAGWRLKIGRDAPADLVARLPRAPRYGGWVDRVGPVKALAVFAAASAAVVMTVVSTPGWLGPLVPVSWERWIGDGLAGDMSAQTCSTPASDAALAALADELDRGRPADAPPVRIALVRSGAVNAVAIPGARVLVFDGLVQAVGSPNVLATGAPDALAGVVGHELGHVRKRHVMQAMLRQLGLAFVLGGWKSGMGNMLGQMAAMRYSRAAETEADAFSRARLAEAGISPLPTAGFFDVLAHNEGPASPLLGAYFASHPESAARAQAFRAAFRPGQVYRPALNEAQFSAILGACAQTWRPQASAPGAT